MPTMDKMAPWGKLNRNQPVRDRADRLSLVGHCSDVAAVARGLMELPTWRARLQRLAGREFTTTDLDRLTVLAFLHDVGKAGAGFYSKGLTDAEQAAWLHRVHQDRSQLGHTRVVAPLLRMDASCEEHRKAIGIPRLQAWAEPDAVAQEAVMDLWLAAVSHHGEPISYKSLIQGNAPLGHATWTVPIAGYDPLSGLNQLRETAERLWPQAFADAQPMPEPAQPLIHAFAGLVSLADWIGSNTDHFPFNLGPQDAGRWPCSQTAAHKALRDMRIDLEASRLDLRARSPSFCEVFGFRPTDPQAAAADAPLTSPVVLEAETGSGKTEAALWRFKRLFELGEVDALCFLLPTRVAATGIQKRLQQFVDKLFPDPDLRPNTVLAVPGYLRANGKEGKWLAPFTVQWPDQEVGAPLFWAAENSKRYFAAAAAAATIDQFLLSTLKTKHAHLRASVLLRSLVVVDEVHASDPYMRALMLSSLQRHLVAGGHALLLSATLTSDLRQQLLAAAPRPKSNVFARPASPASRPLTHDYPRVSAPGYDKTFGPIERHKRIGRELQPWMRDADAAAVAMRAVQAMRAGARVLVLRNTVRQAVATQQALETLLAPDHPALFRCQGVVALHHGRYAFADRQALDLEVGRRFGKEAAESREAVVLCATQTVEISVDCDADFMITDLAPMDVLLQRLGRLHRHAKRNGCRPAAHAQAQCLVLVPPDDNLSPLLSRGGARGLGVGSNSAYPDVLCLQATLRALRDEAQFPVLDIPTHNRELVERTCGRAALQALAQELGGPWLSHSEELYGKGIAQGLMAQYACTDWQEPWHDAVANELDPEAKTRLGLDGIELELPPSQRSPFGHLIDKLTVPAWMLRGQPADVSAALPLVEDLHVFEGGFCFSVRGQPFRYDRHGLTQQRPQRQ
jgi:CRISPR-associated endonuclease/helicase Cas3